MFPTNPAPYYGQPGFNYSASPVPRLENVLTEEEIARLRNSRHNQFSLKLDPLEITGSACSHRHKGQFVTQDNADGSVTCTICGETYTPVDYNFKEVEELVSNLINVLQTAKSMYFDLPAEAARDFMPIIALLRKVPKLYELAVNNFNKYDNPMVNPAAQSSAFSIFNQIMGGGSPYMMNPAVAPGAYYQQPGMMQPSMPAYPAYPAPPMAYGQPAPYGVNPMTGQPSYPTAPAGYTPDPLVAAASAPAPATPVVGAAPEAPVVTQVFNV